jgi:Undecaprenyl-phosphate glucose phosphotransferase
VEHWKDYKSFLLRITADVVTIVTAWFFSYYLRFYIIPGGVGKPLFLFTQLGLIMIVLFIYFINKQKLYYSMRNISWVNEITSVMLASFQSILSFVIILYFFFPSRVSRLTISIFLVIVIAALIVERIIVKNFLFRLREKGWNTKSILLIGFGPAMKKYVKAYSALAYGLKIVGQFGAEKGKAIPGIHQFKDDLEKILETRKPDIVVVSFPESYNEVSQKYITTCYDRISTLMIILDFKFFTIDSKIVSLKGQHAIQVNHTTLSNFDRMLKRFFDILLSLIGLVLSAPLMMLIALAVRISSKGSIFFSQERVTEGDRIFKMVKFRSMKQDTSTLAATNLQGWTVKNDPRVTGIGKFLRRTSLDELPQLFNVLIGKMSLIGPRPERPELTIEFGQKIPGYRLRHKVKSGISGWAQVNGWRGNTSLPKRIEFDLYYIQNWSLLLDFKIILLTIIKGFINKNAY